MSITCPFLPTDGMCICVYCKVYGYEEGGCCRERRIQSHLLVEIYTFSTPNNFESMNIHWCGWCRWGNGTHAADCTPTFHNNSATNTPPPTPYQTSQYFDRHTDSSQYFHYLHKHLAMLTNRQLWAQKTNIHIPIFIYNVIIRACVTTAQTHNS